MSRKYSLAYLTIPGTDPVTQIHIAKKAGYDAASLRTIPMHLPGEPEFILEKDPELFAQIKNALREEGIALHDIELARIREDLDVRDYEPAFEKAAELSCKDVLGSVWTRNKSFYTEKVAEIAEMLAKYGMNYNVEFLPWAGVRSLQEDITLIEKMRSYGFGNVFIMLDTLHAGRAGVTAEEIRRSNLSMYRFLHLCDGPAGPDGDPVLDNIKDDRMLATAREARFYPGDGAMGVKALVDSLPGVDISIELPNLREMEARGAEGHARECLRKAKELLAEE